VQQTETQFGLEKKKEEGRKGGKVENSACKKPDVRGTVQLDEGGDIGRGMGRGKRGRI